MFPRTFKNDHKFEVGNHNAITFRTPLKKEKVVELLLEKGIQAFLKPDAKLPVADYSAKLFEDNRIEGMPDLKVMQGCCAFTKNSSLWYLFPIHKNELANVGLDGDDLVKWITFMNNMKVGFDYLYLGEQEYVGTYANGHKFDIAELNRNDRRIPNNTFYWVAVPAFEGETVKIPYLHWISLRYMFNTAISMANHNRKGLACKQRFALYNLPRIAMMLHEDLGVPKHRAYLYAHIANPFRSDWGLAYTDGMGDKVSEEEYAQAIKRGDAYAYMDLTNTQPKPCVNLTAPLFKAIWFGSKGNTLMNRMLTTVAFENESWYKGIKGLVNLSAPYNVPELYSLFDNGEYEKFVDAIRKSYGLTKAKSTGSKIKTTTIRKAVRNGKKVATI